MVKIEGLTADEFGECYHKVTEVEQA